MHTNIIRTYVNHPVYGYALNGWWHTGLSLDFRPSITSPPTTCQKVTVSSACQLYMHTKEMASIVNLDDVIS